MTEMKRRNVVIYELPIPEANVILHPHSAVLRFGEAGTQDVGALCYLRRESASRRGEKLAMAVDESSYDPERAQVVERIIRYLSRSFEFGETKPWTLLSFVRDGINTFMNWADMNNHTSACCDENSARIALVEFNQDLRERVMRGELASITAARYINSTFSFLSELLEVDDLRSGINVIRRKRGEGNLTVPPDDLNIAKVIGLSEALFKGLSHLVIKNETLPYKLAMPKYLGWTQDHLWLFPIIQWFLPPTLVARDESKRPIYTCYDYTEGRILDYEEVRYKGKHTKKRIQNAKEVIKAANNEIRHHFRLRMAMVAHHAFLLMFLANTGMNFKQIMDLTWDGDYDVDKSRKGFRAIKSRALGRNQSFEIQSVFFPVFIKFLELRDFILDKNQCDTLFLRLSYGRLVPKRKISVDSLMLVYDILKRIDPVLPKITPRQWRAADGFWMLKNRVPVSIVASILQNSEAVVRNTYSFGSPGEHMKEMSAFLERVSQVVFTEKKSIKDGVETSVGFCRDYENPVLSDADVPILPDCHNSEGCLFCDKHKVHADERDVRKLISCRYCIQQTSGLAASMEEFKRIYGPILERIKILLEEIERRLARPGFTEAVRHSVEVLGELDDYWAGRLAMLINLDLISE